MPTDKEAVLDRLRRQRALEDNSDVAALHQDWLRAIDDLMKQIRAWLSEAQQEGLFVISEADAELTEPGVGSYPVKDLILTTPKGETIQITPRARQAAGTYGRVDMKCPPKKRILVRDESMRWQFAHLGPGNPGWDIQDLTEESFWQAIGDLIS
jgi:hypothetical protein